MAEIIHDIFFNYIPVINDALQFIGLIIVIIAGLYMFSLNHIRTLRTLLSDLGFRRRRIFRVLLLCRKNPRRYVRVFCEYMILKSGGVLKNDKWWEVALKDFIAFLKDAKNDEFFYDIENVTDVIWDDKTSDNIDADNSKGKSSIKKYFDYFRTKKIRQAYGMSNDAPVSFYISLRIKYGFLSNNFLLSGLLAEYKDDWTTFVERYISLVNNEKYYDELYPTEVFFTFAWLLWGPSFKLESQQGDYKICQLAFGDESNSISVVLTEEEKFQSLYSRINQQLNGIVCRFDGKIYSADDFVNYNREYFSSFSNYYVNKIADRDDFVLVAQNYAEHSGYKAQNYYCTAYVWIMFCSVNNADESFSAQKSITFFEHANIADSSSYEFCVEALVNKSFAFFDQVFTEKHYNRKYRYVLSMNSVIEDRFLENLNKRLNADGSLSQKYRNNFYPQKLHSPNDVFSAIDNYFLNVMGDMEFIEVFADDRRSMELFGGFYTGVYKNVLSDIGMSRKFDTILNYIEKKEQQQSGNNYHLILQIHKNTIVSGIVCHYFAKANCGYLESIAVGSEYQLGGHGTKLHQKATEVLEMDARKCGQAGLGFLITAINHGSLAKNKMNRRFWKRLGYLKLSMPPDTAGKLLKKSTEMQLIALPLLGEYKTSIPKEELNDCLADLLNHIGIDNVHGYTINADSGRSTADFCKSLDDVRADGYIDRNSSATYERSINLQEVFFDGLVLESLNLSDD